MKDWYIIIELYSYYCIFWLHLNAINRKKEKFMDNTKFSNPFAFGVFGLSIACFALAPVLLGLVKKGVMGFIPWAVLFGGLAQLISGIIDLRNKSILAGTAFSSYGLLWIGLGIELLFKGVGLGASSVIGGNVDIALLLMSLAFTLGFASSNLITFLLLVQFDLVFAGLVLKKLGIVAPSLISPILGVMVYIVGVTAAYAAAAFVLNNHYDRKVLPMGPVLLKKG